MPCNIYQNVRQVSLSKKSIQEVALEVLSFLNKKNFEVSVHLVGDKKIRSLNVNWRGKDKVTDVLSFAAQEESFVKSNDLGDIFICVPQVKRQAKKQNIPYKEEFFRMLAHGILHVNGYDHITKKEETKMFALQERFVKKFV